MIDMIYRAVGNRCAVDLESLDLPVSRKEALALLKEKRCRQIEVDMGEIANDLVGRADWKLPSGIWEAPYYFDCSGFTKWIYGQKGISIPRRPIQQYEFCREFGKEVSLKEVITGDLLFVTSPYVNGVRTSKNSGIGHVCFAANPEEITCATNSEFGTGVVKVALKDIFTTRTFCAAGRIIPESTYPITLLTSPGLEVESSDDIKYMILKSCQK